MSVYDTHKIPTNDDGPSLYLNLKDGDSVKVRILGEPHIFTRQYDEESPIQTRYAWVVYNQDLKRAQVFEQGVRGYKAIANLATDPDWGDLAGYDIKITREGASTDTKYHFTPSPNKTEVTPEQTKAVEAVDMTKAKPNSRKLSDFIEDEALPDPATAKKDQVTIDSPDQTIDLENIPF